LRYLLDINILLRFTILQDEALQDVIQQLLNNVQDFRRYEPAGIQAIHPETVLPSH
jgi:hypothetical protein